MATVTQPSGPRTAISRHDFSAAKTVMTPSGLVTLGLILLIPVLITAGPILASALIARYHGVGWSGGMVFGAIGVLVGMSALASAYAFRLAWRRGGAGAPHRFSSLAR
ncbi:hypothetical protein ACFWUP_04575 [Nocardia sp. NPDC058658]|uniref:hypothetical protein n=1 Tax=Nocardia sp. NPDC058658 TaxID=3346580 RepID=UPI003657EF31